MVQHYESICYGFQYGVTCVLFVVLSTEVNITIYSTGSNLDVFGGYMFLPGQLSRVVCDLDLIYEGRSASTVTGECTFGLQNILVVIQLGIATHLF